MQWKEEVRYQLLHAKKYFARDIQSKLILT